MLFNLFFFFCIFFVQTHSVDEIANEENSLLYVNILDNNVCYVTHILKFIIMLESEEVGKFLELIQKKTSLKSNPLIHI